MDISQTVLSNIIVHNKYAKYIPELKRREVWKEICDRNMQMHLNKFPELEKDIKTLYENFVIPKKVLPSMRSMQFGGLPIEMSNIRMYNCSAISMNTIVAFREILFLLLSGCGVGVSVQKHHVNNLPVLKGTNGKTKRFLIEDSIMGWSESVHALIDAFYNQKHFPLFDYRDIREKGSPLITSGGKAPGPEPLKICLEKIEQILTNAVGRKLKTIEVHDIACIMADAVLAGGIRRAALISLFSANDMDMLLAKSGEWGVKHPYRCRANNTVMLLRNKTSKEEFQKLWKIIRESNAGEPGFKWCNSLEVLTNPCGEIAIEDMGVCNLSVVNVSDIESQEDLNERSKAAAFLATLQASYTDFYYLRPEWKEKAERDALIGVSHTGIASAKVLQMDLEEAAKCVIAENKRVAKLIGINPAKRTTTNKPDGTTSLVLGTSSGIHAWHNDYYIRRVRIGKNERMYHYMKENFPELIEDCAYKPEIEAVMSFPQKAPIGAILRHESAIEMLERVKKYNVEWIATGHIEGVDKNNVSCTVNIKDHEWEPVCEWLWNNKEDYTAISVMPYDGGTYVQAPFEDCSKEKFEEMMTHLHNIDLENIIEEDDNTDLSGELACAGGGCTI